MVGEQSTIMEESLLKKKYAFIYDTENFVSSFGFYRKKENKFFITRNFYELEKSLSSILKKDLKFIEDYKIWRKQFCNNYLSDNGKINNFNNLRNKIRQYIESENDKY